MQFNSLRPLLLSALTLTLGLPAILPSEAQARPGDSDGHTYYGGRDDRGRGRGDDRGRGRYSPPPVYVPPRDVRRLPSPPIYRDPYYRGPHRGPIVFIERGNRRYYRPPVRVILPPPVIFYRPIPNVIFVDVLAEWRRTRRIDYLGQTSLEVNEQDYDVIQVQQCGISQLNLHVLNNDALISQVIVNYKDGGDPTPVDINAHFYASAFAQQWIDLPGYERCVSDVVVIGSTVGDPGEGDRQAIVEIYGERP